jgi:23S rRNA pseudouridine2605 synthase
MNVGSDNVPDMALSIVPLYTHRMFEGERIAKVMARAGLASRRQAEQWIADGRVSVNGAVITSPALNVTPRDKIAVDGQALRARERTRLFLYNKMRGLMTTHSDPEGRPTIFAALPKNLPRLISVGRLDYNTEGLLLLTNDGALARLLELPKTAWERRYRVRALGRITQDALDRLKNGVNVDSTHYGAIEATLDREQGANVWLTFAIKEGKNREVRNVLLHLGLKVNRLIRVGFGPFELGDLDDGEVEEVPAEKLRATLGDSIVKESGADFAGPVLEHKPAPRPHRDPPKPATERNASTPDNRRQPKKKFQRRDRSSGPRPSRPKPSAKPSSKPRDER